MAWNEPDNDDRKHDAWGGGPRGGRDQGPPDLDEVLRNLNRKFSRLFGGKNRGGGGFGDGGDEGGGLSGGLVAGVLVIAALIWVAAGFYTVDEQERGVVLRFGRALDAVVPPGLHWNPALIDEVIKVNVTRVFSREFSGSMLTVDDNILDLAMSVQYVITDARAFFLNVRNPEDSLAQAAESAIRHVVGSTEMTTALTVGREQMAQDVQLRLQRYLENYGTGISVSQVNIERSQPPAQVREAFDDVIKADEDKRSIQNEALRYASQVVPEARGNARRIIEDANAYSESTVARAEGEARRFEQLVVEYQKAPLVTRTRLYLDALEDVMSNASKVLVDVEGGNNLLYLPLDQMMRREGNVEGSLVNPGTLSSPETRRNTGQTLREAPSRQSTTIRGGGR